jgi:hypothetical protein
MAPQQKEALLFSIQKATLRLVNDRVQVNDATLKWKEQAEITLRGSSRLAEEWEVFAHASRVPLREFLSAYWQPRLTGLLSGDAEVRGRAGEAAITWKADVVLSDGVLTGLPVLEKLATYTRAERFKRVVLDVAKAHVSPVQGGYRFENIIVRSNGLLRLEGMLKLVNEQIEGTFMLGVTPETLRWIPGAESRVFIESNPQGPPGLLWTHLRIEGPLTAPQEDLSSRLLGAAGMSLVFDTPGAILEKGTDVLLKPILGEEVSKAPSQILNGTSKTIEQGVKAGTNLLNKVVPIFGK